MGEMQLRWKDHDKAMSNKLWEYFNEEYLVDFSVACQGQQIKVHKFVLALLFPMLKESFRSSSTFSLEREELTKDGSPVEFSKIPQLHCLNLDNIADHPEDMDYLIQFAYTGKTTVPKEHADCLMRIADNMEIQSLKTSLDQWHSKKKPKEKSEPKDVICSSRLRPRTEVKVTDESLDLLSSNDDDDDLGANSIFDDDCSDNGDNRKTTRSRKRRTKYTRTSAAKKCQNVVDPSKKTADKTPNTAETPGTNSENEANSGTPSNEETPTTADEASKDKKTLKCPHCVFVAKFPSRLERHMEIHTRTHTKFICKFCKADVGSSNMLNIHRDSKCGKEPLACKYCEFKTLYKHTFQQHIMAKHQVDADGNPLEKNVKCSDCDFVCYAKHQLRIHSLYKHERVNRFKCKECSFTAPYINKLVQHERVIHQKRKDYMCEECGNRYKTSGRLSNHVLVQHKGVKPHKCHICNVEYVNTISFKIHMQRHEGKVEYKFVCHICGHRLRRKFELRTHVQKKHGIELEEDPTAPHPRQIQYNNNNNNNNNNNMSIPTS